jgi:hypothetical protein
MTVRRGRPVGPLLAGAVVALALSACVWRAPVSPQAARARAFTASLRLERASIDLHLSSPVAPVAPAAPVLVLYASGDGGWFGAAVDMFKQVSQAGYYGVGISARSFMKLDRAHALDVQSLAANYAQVLDAARKALALPPSTQWVLTGWSRGAAFAVLAAAQPNLRSQVRGVVAIGLSEGEDFKVGETEDDETTPDDTSPAGGWPFDTYRSLKALEPLRSIVIQATHDGYLPAAHARDLFGPDTPARRLVAIDAKNHRFSGGKEAFDAAFRDALAWVAAGPG